MTAAYTQISTTHPPALLGSAGLLSNGRLTMTLQGYTGSVYSIVTSTNLLTPLSNWTEAFRLTNTTGQAVFTNPPPSSSPQYYRAKEL